MEAEIDYSTSTLLVDAALGQMLFKLACADNDVSASDILALRSRIAGLVYARQNSGQAPGKRANH